MCLHYFCDLPMPKNLNGFKQTKKAATAMIKNKVQFDRFCEKSLKKSGLSGIHFCNTNFQVGRSNLTITRTVIILF